MRKLKRVFAMLLVFCMAMSMMGLTVFAGGKESCYDCGAEEHAHGECELTCTTEYDMTCTAEEHTHEEACYAAHVCSEACADPCEKAGTNELICEKQEHTHSEVGGACYAAHIHTDGCYGCGKAAHTHSEECLSEEAKALIDDARAKLQAIDSLQTMQNKRAATADAATYDAYVEAMMKARAEAQAAYDALDETMKTYIDPALAAKLAPLGTVFHSDVYSTIRKGTEGYQFQAVFPKNRAYEMGTHLNDGGHPMTVIVVDSEEITGSWAPSAQYKFDSSDYEVLYCCEIKQPVADGTHYKRINLEDADYYGKEEAAHIRAIVTNAYPYVSLEQMKKNLKAAGFEYADELTRGDVLTAVQFAIWSYSNKTYEAVEGMDEYGSTIDINNVSYAKAYHDYSNELWSWWKVGRNKTVYDAEAEKRVNALVDYLVGLDKVYAETGSIVISSVEVTGAEAVQHKEGAYNVAVKVKLNNGGLSDKDNVTLKVTSVDEQGNVTAQIQRKVEGSTSQYDLQIEAKAGQTIKVLVEGTQIMPDDAYLYMPEGGKDVSQVLVGIASGKTTVKAEAEVKPDLPETQPNTADILLQKTDEEGAPLTGAKFDLTYMSEGLAYPVGSYSVDEEGKLSIEGLMPGAYQLKETEAPEGYELPENAIAFHVTEEGAVVLDRDMEGISVSAGDAAYVLTVANQPEEEEIPENDPPLGDPEDDPLDEDPEEEETIIEEDIPLGEPVLTGDMSALWGMMLAASASGLCGMGLSSLKRRK
ncbi:MAG: Cys-Gln thioester bond-forming surface protein [Christensenellaceae bacterium]|nr:Cys-Gln thioester bond-forming surface protein [Christensenellaceae bacterium]